MFSFLFLSVISFGVKEMNLNHLEFLRDEFIIEGETKIGYWIYAEKFGDTYIHTEAKGEGVTCVDDVARVAVLYTELYKLYHNEFYLQRAKEALDFVMALQDSDGDFYNFIFDNGSINKQGVTSRKSANWWAARGFWAISNALEIFNEDQDFQKKLDNSAKLAYSFLSKSLDEDYFLNKNSDVSSVFLLGVIEYYKYTGYESAKELAMKIGDSILNTQIKEGLLKGAFNEGTDYQLWHSWGSRQGESLIELYKVTGNTKYLDSAIFLADEFYPILLSLGPVYEIGKYIKMYPQIAYAVEPIISTLVELYPVTHEEKYAYMAVLVGGFFERNNHLSVPMYGPNGEGYDSLHSIYINSNAGAESTISALLSLVRLNTLPSQVQPLTSSKIVGGRETLLFEAEKMDTGIYYFELDNANNIRIKTEESIRIRQKIDNFYSGEYEVYLSGSFDSKTYVKASSGDNSIDKNLDPNDGIMYIGNLNMEENQITLYLKPVSGFIHIDQVILKPIDPIFIFDFDQSYYEFSKGKIEKTTYETKTEESLYTQTAQVEGVFIDNSFLLTIEELFNNDGIVSFSDRKSGNFDNYDGIIGAKYPSEELIKYLTNNVFFYEKEDVYFKFKIDGKDNLILTSQVINLKDIEKISDYMYIVGASDHGNYTGKVMILYQDGSTQEVNIAFSDWCQTPIYGETVLLEFGYRYDSLGITENINPKMYLLKIPLKSTPVQSIFLPQIPTMHIFAISLK
ncbi:hypothetical protein NAAC61_01280 [Petrotoga sp. 8T1HF07.NaAc.6.1]|uniref:hypothetical protein n=1 Tax=Petrotoga sp. 8T1HF07.NaAc.6.1 TaxID=1351838 RepID=UPI00192C9C18|nr:hypothetical protein [Petrotoga sp. 8T1HF07.NaAc.6.1]MBL5980836.1 hypothetical protein [Petrotoga sp. 8T1HF07.NaAc.6.1]